MVPSDAVGAVLPGEGPVEVAVVPVEAGVDEVRPALHAGAPLDAACLVLRDRVDAGIEAPDVVAHLEEKLALGDPGRGGLVAHGAGTTARAYPGSQQAWGPGSRCGSDQRAVMPSRVALPRSGY